MFEPVIEFFNDGGVVMYPLLAVSVLSLAAILERTLFWARFSSSRELGWLDRYAQLVIDGERDAAGSLAKRDASPMGSLVRWMHAHPGAGYDGALVHVESLRPRIERFGSLLGVVIAGAPLLGILGTVVGIIESFDLLGEASSVSDPTLIAGGIAQALYTTAAGLTIALFTLFPASVFRARAAMTLSRLESLAAMLSGQRVGS
jgi:biopolymer transport protein ExbB